MKLKTEKELTHLDSRGLPSMVDIAAKAVSSRTAKAKGRLKLPAGLDFTPGDPEIKTAKGSVLQTAVIAGTLAVKRTSDLIPFCHPLPVEKIKFEHSIHEDGILEMTCEVSAQYKTGVEMEALTGVNIALLTVYDMCKSAGQDMMILEIEVVHKSGGNNDVNRE